MKLTTRVKYSYAALLIIASVFFLYSVAKGRLFDRRNIYIESDTITVAPDSVISSWRTPDTLHINYATLWQLSAAGFSPYDINLILFARSKGYTLKSQSDLIRLFARRDTSKIGRILTIIQYDYRTRQQYRYSPRPNYQRPTYTHTSRNPLSRRIPLFLADSLELSQAGMTPAALDTLAAFQKNYILSGSMSFDSLINCSPADLASRLTAHIRSARRPLFVAEPERPRPDPVELNHATREQLVLIPGIGEKTADQIIEMRQRLGGFVSPEQLVGVWPVTPETYALMSPYLLADSTAIIPINVNNSNNTRMWRHPYFPTLLVKRIEQFRYKHPRRVLNEEDIRYCAEDIELSPYFWHYVTYGGNTSK